MNRIISEALDVLYPENLYCICCGDMIHQSRVHGICDECMKKLRWISENPFDGREGFSFDSVISLVSYDYYAQSIVHALKFHEKNYIAKNAGSLMGELFALNMEGDELFVPVPMYKRKERLRGYNQAALLAKYAAEKAGCEYMEDALLKTVGTKSMRTARAEGRKFALDNSIELNLARTLQLKGRNIVLVDDVVTTGTTAEVCSRALRFAGTKKITVLSFAVVDYKGNGL